MEKKAKPLNRQELSRLLVTDADAFTQLRFLRHRDAVPALSELEQSGKEEVPGVEGALCDIYHSLWAQKPELRSEEQVPADRRFWHTLLGSALASSQYEAMHAQTKLSDLKSLIGTITMSEAIVRQVPEEDKEKLQKSAEAQAKADEAEAEAQQAEAEADAAEGMSDAAAQAAGEGQGDADGTDGQPSESQSGAPSGAPQSGSGEKSLEEAQALANALAKQAAEARAKAESARAVADAAERQAEAVAEELLGQPGSDEAVEKLQELVRIGLSAARAAREKVEEVSDTIQSWGLEEGELVRGGMPEAMGILERMNKSDAFRKFAKLLGRVKKIAARKARSADESEGVRMTVQETGRDIRRAVRSELVALTGEITRHKALTRWARGELRLHGEEAKQKLGEGPVVVCEDSSGSMDGEKRQWAKAVTLALAHYAKLRQRSFAWIMFDSSVQCAKVYPRGKMSAKDILEIAESSSGGGTNFERPLSRAAEVIREEGLKKADIAFITDGDCAVGESFLREFLATKGSLDINVFTVLCDVGHTSDSAVEEFSDCVETVSEFGTESASAVIGGVR